MTCPEGYFSLPRDNAPERISLQTGIICNLFGVTSPLCKWVDELLPSLPIADSLKDVGKQMAKQIRKRTKGKINFEVLQADAANPAVLKNILDWKAKIDEVNQIIDDIIDTVQGGEISTLEFCLAGKPEFPEPINFGDVFLAFSGIYPANLVDKLSRIIAYQKYFEVCECRQHPVLRPLEENIGDLVQIPTYGSVLGNNLCNPTFELFLANFVNPENLLAKKFATRQGWEQKIAQDKWITTNPFIDFRIPYDGFRFEYCTTQNLPFEIVDIPMSSESITFLQNGALSGCCRLTMKRYRREVRYPSFDIEYTYQDPDLGQTVFYLSGQNSMSPCLTGNSGTSTALFRLVERGENICGRPPVGEPPDLEIKPINPTLNPCDDPEAVNYEALCPDCPPCPPSSCQEITTQVPVINDCVRQIEPRSLFWN